STATVRRPRQSPPDRWRVATRTAAADAGRRENPASAPAARRACAARARTPRRAVSPGGRRRRNEWFGPCKGAPGRAADGFASSLFSVNQRSTKLLTCPLAERRSKRDGCSIRSATRKRPFPAGKCLTRERFLHSI